MVQSSSIQVAHQSRFHLKTDTESSLRNVTFLPHISTADGESRLACDVFLFRSTELPSRQWGFSVVCYQYFVPGKFILNNLNSIISLLIRVYVIALLFINFYFKTENAVGLQERKRIEVEVQDPNNDDDCEEGDDCTDDLYYYFIIGEYIFLSHLNAMADQAQCFIHLYLIQVLCLTLKITLIWGR
jgi:hypothetical protein